MTTLGPNSLVRVINHKPYFGSSLNGTLGRISRFWAEWLLKYQPNKTHESLYVELYRTHRRTGRPLKPKEVLMRSDQVVPVSETDLNEEQRRLISHFAIMEIERKSQAFSMRRERKAWERDLLRKAGHELAEPVRLPPEMAARLPRSAEEQLDLLERLLMQNPPEGTHPEQVGQFFGRHRETLQATLRALMETVVIDWLEDRKNRLDKSRAT